MFSGSALFVAVLSSLSLAQSASNNATNTSGPAVPECAAKCMSVKITEAAAWFGAGDVSSYCKHPEFLIAYNNCLHDNCHDGDLTVGKQAGVTACAGVTPNAGGHGDNAATGTDPSNSTAHLSGPANAPGDGSTTTVVPGKAGTNPASPAVMPTAGLNGALPTAPSGANATNTTTGAPSRFSGAVGSAAANASSQAADASAISSSSVLLFTALSSCVLSLFL